MTDQIQKPQFDLDELFSYHPPIGNQPERYDYLRGKGKAFAQAVLDCTAPGADQSAAIRHIREACMTANAAIALGAANIALPKAEGFGFLSIQSVAVICHNANAAYCRQIGDDSQVPWGDAPEWQQKSAITGVEFVLANPDAPASSNHESWLREKERDGWKYGPVKNPETKQHPCFVPYDQLPPEQQAKDHLFKGIVESLRPFINLGVAEAPSNQADGAAASGSF